MPVPASVNAPASNILLRDPASPFSGDPSLTDVIGTRVIGTDVIIDNPAPMPLFQTAPAAARGNVTAVHATVDFFGHDSLLVEVFDHATGTWVELASKNVEGQNLGSSDVASIHSDGSAGWNAGSLQIRVTDRTTGQVIEQGSGQFRTEVNADGSITIRVEDRTGGDDDFNDVVIRLENDTGAVTRRGLSAVQPLPALPFTDEQLNQIQKDGSKLFFDKLAAAPAGSPAATLYNLFRARSLDQLPEFKGKVDLNAINADIQTLMQDPGVQQLLAAAQSESALALTGMDSTTAAQNIYNSLLSDETISHLKQLTPEARQQYVNSALTQLAFFDPAKAKAAMQELMKALLTQGTPQEMLANASPEATELAVQAVFQISITQSRFGMGALSNAGTFLTKLSESQLGEAQTAFAEWARQGADPARIDEVFGGLMAEGMLSETSFFAVRNFAKNLADTGALGSVGGVLAGIAVVQDFTGTGTMTTQTPWGIVNTTADVMSLVGASENIFKSSVKLLGLTRDGFNALRAAVLAADAASPGQFAGDVAMVNLAAQETAAGASTAAELAAAVEAGGVAAGVAPEGAAAASAIAGAAGATEVAEVSAASAGVFARVLSGLGVLGSAANFLYGAKSADAAHKSFAEGDVTGGILSTGAATGFFAGGTAGVAAFIGTTFEVAALSGPLAPLVALGATITGFGFALGNYFHQKHRHQEQIDDTRNFLASGVGTGRSYLLP